MWLIKRGEVLSGDRVAGSLAMLNVATLVLKK